MSQWHSLCVTSRKVSDRTKDYDEYALNADYNFVDAVALISTKCGKLGLKYNEDFKWLCKDGGEAVFLFREEKYITMLGMKI